MYSGNANTRTKISNLADTMRSNVKKCHRINQIKTTIWDIIFYSIISYYNNKIKLKK